MPQAHTSADRGPTGDGGSRADSGGGAPPPRGRGRSARPQPVATDTDEQAVPQCYGGAQKAPQHAYGYHP